MFNEIYEYDKDALKASLDIDQVAEYLTSLDADPIVKNDVIISKTICHNLCGCGSHKLYYYGNTGLFKCYTDCDGSAWDIFELTRKVMSREYPQERKNSEWTLPEAIEYVAQFFNFAPNEKQNSNFVSITDHLKLLKKYDKINNIKVKKQNIELKIYNGDFLKNLPKPVIQDWIDEGISQEVMNNAGICYDPKNQGIVIPHYDINGNLVGVRERTLIKENAERFGKYMPAKIAGKQYAHPLSYNLYNLNHSKENISRIKKAIIFEGEKACLKYRSMFGEENDISVATCGCNLLNYQFSLLSNLGVKEIIVAYDRQYKEIGDIEYKTWVNKLKSIAKKYSAYCLISFMFDVGHLLDYKNSPIDKTKEVFLTLFKNRLDSEGR